MTFLKFGIRRITDSLVLNIVVITTLVVSLIAICLMLMSIEEMKNHMQITEELLDDNAILYKERNASIPILNTDGTFDIDNKSIMDYLEDYVEQVEVYYIYNSLACTYNNQIDSAYGMSDYLYYNLEMKLYKGEKKKLNNGYIGGLSTSSSTLKIGDIVNMDYNGETFQIMITGILAEDALCLKFTKSGTNMCISDYLLECGKDKMVICPIDDIILDIPENIKGAYIDFGQSVSQEELSIISDNLSINGWAYTMDSIKSNTEEEMRAIIYMYLPLIIPALIFIIFFNIMLIYYLDYINRKNYSILSIIGANNKDLLAISLLHIFIINLFSAIIYIVGVNILENTYIDKNIYFSNKIAYMVLLIGIGSFLVISFIYSLYFNSKNRNKIIHYKLGGAN